ncbi:TadA family conjugal transfer-associated ATPase [Lysinibacter sp. HNR]|uniref:TadA family conjugal transfer-associated ATPase n=1 Tax=Lysinibacter sp. HNR TaxID=3031408 RepID=UPI002434B9E6|nr:TadA family conjugal transfer-associated ATPase [Lysinibacter sp. HNR]WGD37081.1 TadA family conjugal transfer-associated ATPase [Lysinibacter sp. HNR]
MLWSIVKPMVASSYELLALLGPLAYLVDDPQVTDIFVNGGSGVWVDRGAGAVRESSLTLNREQARGLAVRLISRGGRHVDETTPCVDVRLGRGLRVHAVLPPIAREGPLLSIRVPRERALSLDDLYTAGMFGEAVRAVLLRAIQNRQNILITGAGGCGKTTLLAALMGCVPAVERIITIEDVAELNIHHPHCVSLEARQKNLEGAGGLGLDQLVREALRMRPDRIVVGECRGPELRELLSALNTGHDGGAGTLHANSLADVPARLEALGAVAGFLPHTLARQVVSAIHLVVQLERTGGVRSISGIGSFFCDETGVLGVREYRFEGSKLSAT